MGVPRVRHTARAPLWLSFPTVLFTLTGYLDPVVVPSLFILAGRSHEPLDSFWRRCLDPTTLRARWYAVLVGLVVALATVPTALPPGMTIGIAAGPLAFLVVGMLAGAAEEPAWRGCDPQAVLQGRLPVVAASLIVEVLWAAWHLPMFRLEGTYQHGLGIGTLGFPTFRAVLVVSSPIYAWLVVDALPPGAGDDVALTRTALPGAVKTDGGPGCVRRRPALHHPR